MRRSTLLLLFYLLTGVGLIGTLIDAQISREQATGKLQQRTELVRELGLADLAIFTEARYTRHPAASDRLAPFMDHPGSLEHFPSATFLVPVLP